MTNSNSSQIALIDCPFCGYPGVIKSGMYGFHVKCSNSRNTCGGEACGIKAPTKNTIERAVTVWNRRN